MKTISNLYEKLATIAYPVMFGTQCIKVWKEATDHREQKPFEYRVDEKLSGLLITDTRGIILAENLDDKKAIAFLEADMGVGSPIPGAQVMYAPGSRDISENTTRVITKAAKKHGMDADSIINGLKSRKKVGISGTVKKKRKIDISDLDLDD